MARDRFRILRSDARGFGRTTYEAVPYAEAEDIAALMAAAGMELDPPLRLADIRVPVTVIAGERDVRDFVAIAQRLAAELPQATLDIVPAAGHLPALERPQAVAELITSRR